jgi:N5-(cytidine 5'-diphosphoramidyl)-L-glutamine hydrolase
VSGPARVGVTQRVEVLADRDERRDCLDQEWAALLEAAGYVPVPVPNRLADPAAFVAALDLALIVLTGGNDLAGLPGAVATAPERDRTERALLEAGVPVLGVCRGLQLMVVEAGGRLERVEGHVAVRHGVTAESVDWPIRSGPVNSFHDWGVADPGTLTVLARSDDGRVEAAAHRDRPQVGIMWHPERAPTDPVDLALLRALVEGGPCAP